MASEDVLSGSTVTTEATSTEAPTSTTSTQQAGPQPNGPQPNGGAPTGMKPRQSYQPRGNNADSRKLFVGGIQRQTNQDSFKAFFEEFGPVEEAFLIADKQNPDMHRGFGFITFKDQASTDRVLDEGKNGKLLLHGASVDFRIAVPPMLKAPPPLKGTTKLFVGGCPKEGLTSDELTEYMKQFGAVQESWVSTKGFGFVTFEDINGCNKALIEGFKGKHELKGAQLDVKWPRVKNKAMYGAGPRPRQPYGYNQYRQPYQQPQGGYYAGQQQYGQPQPQYAYQYQMQPPQPQQQAYAYGQAQAGSAPAYGAQPSQQQQPQAVPTVGQPAAAAPQPQSAYIANRGGQQPQGRYAPY